jgi:hypothetical protein
MKPVLVAGLLACLAAPPAIAEEKGTTYGTGVTLQTSVTVADLLKSPEDHVGKTVRVDGVVQAVCQTMGCWIQLGDEEDTQGIQFKVDDGVIVFPKDGKGRKASAEGTFERIALGDAHEIEHARETMKQTGSEAPKYRIRATGAVIY